MRQEQVKYCTLYNCDCMELMAQYPDKYFDLAIADPPYGIGEDGSKNYTRGKLAAAKNYKPFSGNDKNPPDAGYFSELFRVSKYQIIWGANHFISRIPFDSPCWIVWDKMKENLSFADCELAWTNFQQATKKLTFRWNGFLQGFMKEKEIRIHPTQKPVALYKWLLSKYAKPGWKILDTHLGSGSHAVACYDMGFPLTACEIDEDYFSAAVERLRLFALHGKLDFRGGE